MLRLLCFSMIRNGRSSFGTLSQKRISISFKLYENDILSPVSMQDSCFCTKEGSSSKSQETPQSFYRFLPNILLTCFSPIYVKILLVCANFGILILFGFDPAKMNPHFPEPYRIDLSVYPVGPQGFPRFGIRQSHLSFKVSFLLKLPCLPLQSAYNFGFSLDFSGKYSAVSR